jgi:hypothetical protein
MPSRRAIAAGPELFLTAKPQDLDRIDRRLATLIDAARLSGIDPLQLAFTAQIGFEFGEHTQHVEERLARRGAGIDWLFSRLQGDTSGLELVHDVLKVLQRARQTVDAGDDQGVAGAQKFEQNLQLSAAVAARATGLLGANHLAARGL